MRKQKTFVVFIDIVGQVKTAADGEIKKVILDKKKDKKSPLFCT